MMRVAGFVCRLSRSTRQVPRRARRGVSLVEVMFAIGVVVIGLLGVALLLPLAGQQAVKGTIADRTNYMGASAEQEFDVRGMRRISNWLMVSLNPPPPFSIVPLSPGASYCIDPRLVARHATSPVVGGNDARLFPYVVPMPGPPPRRMLRITLRSAPGSVLGMDALQADAVFGSGDDLDIIRPSDRTLPPIQEFGRIHPGADGQWGVATVDDDGNGMTDDASEAGWPGSDDTGTKRSSQGTMSWMATLVPKENGQGVLRDQYTLSIVVFGRRDASLAMDELNERVVNVNFLGGGYGGGDVQLTTRNSTRPPEDLDLEEEDWVLLAGQVPAAPPAQPMNIFKWYRVVATESEPEYDSAGMVYHRGATLHGGDWPLTAQPTEATLVTGVVAVLEKTIRLETSSLWTQ